MLLGQGLAFMCVQARMSSPGVCFRRVSFDGDFIFCARAAEQHPSHSGCRTRVLLEGNTSFSSGGQAVSQGEVSGPGTVLGVATAKTKVLAT